MSTAYVQYHRQPHSQYLSIDEYNQKFGTNIHADHEFDTYFKQAYKKARAEAGMGEFIQQNFRKPETGANYMPQKPTSQVRPRVSYDEPVAVPAKRSLKKEPAVKFVEEAEIMDEVQEKAVIMDDIQEEIEKQVAPKKQSVKVTPNLSDFLNDETLEEFDEEEAWEEVEEEMQKTATQHTLEEIDNYVHANAKDANAFVRDKQHLIVFQTGAADLGEKLMKGRARYLERLKQYAKGDKSVKVRMMSGKEVLVSSLKPNISSLQKMLAATSGAPRFCDCDC